MRWVDAPQSHLVNARNCLAAWTFEATVAIGYECGDASHLRSAFQLLICCS
jgi:hypothetical protein